MNKRRLVGPETLKYESEQNIICVEAPISDPRREMQHIYMCGLRWYIFDFRVVYIFLCVAWWGYYDSYIIICVKQFSYTCVSHQATENYIVPNSM